MIERVIRTADGHSLGDLQSSQSNTVLPRRENFQIYCKRYMAYESRPINSHVLV